MPKKLKKPDPRIEITEAFLKHLNKQVTKSINELVNVAYQTGWNDAQKTQSCDAKTVEDKSE